MCAPQQRSNSYVPLWDGPALQFTNYSRFSSVHDCVIWSGDRISCSTLLVLKNCRRIVCFEKYQDSCRFFSSIFLGNFNAIVAPIFYCVLLEVSSVRYNRYAKWFGKGMEDVFPCSFFAHFDQTFSFLFPAVVWFLIEPFFVEASIEGFFSRQALWRRQKWWNRRRGALALRTTRATRTWWRMASSRRRWWKRARPPRRSCSRTAWCSERTLAPREGMWWWTRTAPRSTIWPRTCTASARARRLTLSTPLVWWQVMYEKKCYSG